MGLMPSSGVFCVLLFVPCMTALEVAHRLDFLNDNLQRELVSEADELAAMLHGLIERISSNQPQSHPTTDI